MPFDPYEDRRRTLDAMSAFAGVPGVQGDEAERRRQQSASMDEYLRKAGVGPDRQMRIDPETAGQSLDAIARSPVREAPPAPAAGPPRQGYTAQPIAAAPQPVFGAGSFGPSYSLQDPMIGAGINVRDSEQTQLAKMGMKREAELAAINSAIAADRNAVAGRGVDAGIFDTLTRANADRERLNQGERFQQAEGQRQLQALQSAEGIADANRRLEEWKTRFAVGPEAATAALNLLQARAKFEQPEKAGLIDAATRQGGAPAPAGPGAAAPAQAPPGETSQKLMAAYSMTPTAQAYLGLSNLAGAGGRKAQTMYELTPSAMGVSGIGSLIDMIRGR